MDSLLILIRKKKVKIHEHVVIRSELSTVDAVHHSRCPKLLMDARYCYCVSEVSRQRAASAGRRAVMIYRTLVASFT